MNKRDLYRMLFPNYKLKNMVTIATFLANGIVSHCKSIITCSQMEPAIRAGRAGSVGFRTATGGTRAKHVLCTG